MADARVFRMRPFPRRLLRSLLMFAGAGTLMAYVVWSDGMGGAWLPLAILLSSWAIPASFAWQIRRNGFDPLERLTISDEGLEASYRDGQSRLVPWAAMQRLVQIEGFRYRAWAVVSLAGPLRWFGELEDADAFAAIVAERANLSWETTDKLPAEAIG